MKPTPCLSCSSQSGFHMAVHLSFCFFCTLLQSTTSLESSIIKTGLGAFRFFFEKKIHTYLVLVYNIYYVYVSGQCRT